MHFRIILPPVLVSAEESHGSTPRGVADVSSTATDMRTSLNHGRCGVVCQVKVLAKKVGVVNVARTVTRRFIAGALYELSD